MPLEFEIMVPSGRTEQVSSINAIMSAKIPGIIMSPERKRLEKERRDAAQARVKYYEEELKRLRLEREQRNREEPALRKLRLEREKREREAENLQRSQTLRLENEKREREDENLQRSQTLRLENEKRDEISKNNRRVLSINAEPKIPSSSNDMEVAIGKEWDELVSKAQMINPRELGSLVEKLRRA